MASSSYPRTIFDRQGLIVTILPEKQSYSADLYRAEKLAFDVVRPGGHVELRKELVEEMIAALHGWFDHG